ncbi:MAG: hypothetical protein KAQ63_01765 [Candidatus Moranbacteria bacterium]|nr:hypothetical protein [Candidatus Moranbacteria bacterium]
MKIKLAMLVGVLMMVGLFSGCVKKGGEEPVSVEATPRQAMSNEDAGLEEKGTAEKVGYLEGAGKSIRELLGKKETFKCSWRVDMVEAIESADTENADEELTGGIAEGVIYVADGKFKQEIKIKENTRENTISIMSDGDWVHQWSSITGQGTKMRANRAEEMGVVDFSKEYGWNCEGWVDDGKIWELPKGMNFVDLSNY